MFVVALVSVPFMIWGQDYVMPWLHSHERQAGVLVAIAIMLLAADSVAPVPATLVIMFLAAKAGRIPGIIGGTVGMTAGVLAAAWLGRAAVGRIAPKFIPDAELARLRESLQRRLAVTLACLRSVPVMAETSVIVAAAAGVPVRRIVMVTILPNFIVSVIYSVAADDSFATACVAFLATMVASYVLWRLLGRSAPGPENAGRPPA
jgi:3-dehydroquinate synthase